MRYARATIILTLCVGAVSFAEDQRDPIARNVAYLKEKLGLDKIPPTTGALRKWNGLEERAAFLEGWVIAGQRVDALMPHGMSRTYFLRKKGNQTSNAAGKNAGRLAVRVFVGVSAEGAREMALQRIALTSLSIRLLARSLTLSDQGPGQLAIFSGKGRTRAVLCFVRDNVAVVFGPGAAVSVNNMDKGIDKELLKAPMVDRTQYDKLCPAISVSSVKLVKTARGRQCVVKVTPLRDAKNCDIIAVLVDGSKGTHEPDQGIIHFRVHRSEGTIRYGIAVYDRESLLSRWITGAIRADEVLQANN